MNETTMNGTSVILEAYNAGILLGERARKIGKIKGFILGTVTGGIVMTAVCLHLWNKAEDEEDPIIEEEVPYPEG